MTNNKKLIIRTVISNALIIVGAGHGIGFLGLIEVAWLPQIYWIGTEDFSLSPASSYDKTLGLVALLCLVGQLLLLSTLLIKRPQIAQIFIIVSLLLLWTGTFYLTHHLLVDTVSLIGFITGLPFLVFSGLLLYRTFRHELFHSAG
jgi:hypothetical protein